MKISHVFFYFMYGIFMLETCSIVIADSPQVQTVKLRIGNPYDYGLYIARTSSLNPRQLLSLEYLPPKGSRYFNGSLDVYVLPTDIIGLWATRLNEKSSDGVINSTRGQATKAFAKGRFSMWRVQQIRHGLTKVFLTVRALDANTLALIPNGAIQDGSVPEITFSRWNGIEE
jgi:hypothetical protein